MITVYHDDPGVTDADRLRISVGVSVPDDTPVDGEIGRMTLAGGAYAFARFELDVEQYGEAWDAVFSGWLPESGFQPTDGVCYEQYHNDANEHPEHKCDVSICVPVKPLRERDAAGGPDRPVPPARRSSVDRRELPPSRADCRSRARMPMVW